MNRDQAEFEKELSELLHKVVNLDGEFVLDGRYMRWGRIEKQVRDIHKKYIAAEKERSKGLVEALEYSGKVICDEFCSRSHHAFCERATEALKKYQENV